MKDGGPAFPYTNCEDHGINGAYGMSLRDYFAAKALATIELRFEIMADDARLPAHMTRSLAYAKYAYEIADAMLKEREK